MSAGAIAVNSWSNQFKKFIGDETKVYSIADSGIFMNFPSILGDMVVQT